MARAKIRPTRRTTTYPITKIKRKRRILAQLLVAVPSTVFKNRSKNSFILQFLSKVYSCEKTAFSTPMGMLSPHKSEK